MESADIRGKKKAQHEGFVVGFIWGEMRTIAQEIAFQIALRNFSTEVGWRRSVYM